jgi:hypothetical protein
MPVLVHGDLWPGSCVEAASSAATVSILTKPGMLRTWFLILALVTLTMILIKAYADVWSLFIESVLTALSQDRPGRRV